MTYPKILNFFLILMMLFICLNLTREHWQNFFNYEIEKENFYIKFSKYLDREILRIDESELLNRDFDKQEIPLEQREKSRWVFLKLLVKPMELIQNFSKNQNKLPAEKISLYLYSFYIGIFFFINFIIIHRILLLFDNDTKKFQSTDITFQKQKSIIFVFFAYLLLIMYLNLGHFRGGEDNYSIAESLLLTAGIFFIIQFDLYKNRAYFFLYIILSMLAPLVRESGIFLSGFYLIYYYFKYNKINFKLIVIPLIAIIPYVIANYDILKFYLEDGFILSTKSIDSQTTWHDLGNNFLGTTHAIFYNFVIFFIPIIIFFRIKNQLQLLFLFFILLYFFLLSFASVLDHVSTRFMPGCLIIIYSYIGIRNINFKNS